MPSVASCIGRLLRCHPRCRFFYIEIDPEAYVVQLPSVFYRKFRHELPSRMYFKDRTRDEIEFIVDKDLCYGYIVDGYRQLINFYKLYDGGWMKVYYAGSGVFQISLRDIDMRRIHYPIPPRRLTLPSDRLDINFINNTPLGFFPEISPELWLQDFDYVNSVLQSDRLMYPDNIGPSRLISDCAPSILGPIVCPDDFSFQPTIPVDDLPSQPFQDLPSNGQSTSEAPHNINNTFMSDPIYLDQGYLTVPTSSNIVE